MGWCEKSPPLPASTSFCPVTSTKVEICPKNFRSFSFNPFTTLILNCNVILTASRKLLNFNKVHPSKKKGFSGQSVKIRGYDNFSHRNAGTTKLSSYGHVYNLIRVVINFVGDVMNINYGVITFILKYLYFKKA